jgi:hypothetical protein
MIIMALQIRKIGKVLERRGEGVKEKEEEKEKVED